MREYRAYLAAFKPCFGSTSLTSGKKSSELKEKHHLYSVNYNNNGTDDCFDGCTPLQESIILHPST